jgi:hypothetical protein
MTPIVTFEETSNSYRTIVLTSLHILSQGTINQSVLEDQANLGF